MKYPKKIMRMTELEELMGFPRQYLLGVYRNPKQDFATKINPLKSNSPIIFDTDEFEAWRKKQIKSLVGRRLN